MHARRCFAVGGDIRYPAFPRAGKQVRTAQFHARGPRATRSLEVELAHYTRITVSPSSRLSYTRGALSHRLRRSKRRWDTRNFAARPNSS